MLLPLVFAVRFLWEEEKNFDLGWHCNLYYHRQTSAALNSVLFSTTIAFLEFLSRNGKSMTCQLIYVPANESENMFVFCVAPYKFTLNIFNIFKLSCPTQYCECLKGQTLSDTLIRRKRCRTLDTSLFKYSSSQTQKFLIYFWVQSILTSCEISFYFWLNLLTIDSIKTQ